MNYALRDPRRGTPSTGRGRRPRRQCTRRDLNPHALRRRNLNPVGMYRDAARCSERRISQGRSLHLAAFRYSPWTIQRRFSRPLATAAGRARVPEPRDDWRRLEDDPIGFLAQNKPLSRARRNLATCAGASPDFAELSYAHGARDLPDQAERTEGQGSRSGQEQSKRRGTTRAKCSAIAPRRGLRRTRGSPPFGASTRRCWTSAVKRGSSGSTHGTTGDTSRSRGELLRDRGAALERGNEGATLGIEPSADALVADPFHAVRGH